MSALAAGELVVGVLLAVITLRDVFDTVVVPGGSDATLKVARRLVSVLLPVWKLARGKRRGISPMFAPLVLVGAFVIWMALLAVAFAMMAHALSDEFVPPLSSFFDALYLAGCSLVTVGLSETDATGAGRWVVVAAGFCGLAVMTMAITYLLMVQTSVSKRDIGIIKLNTSAGDPPSGLAFLENYASTGNRGELPEVLREARNWCTTVRQSHASHPSLIYFRSVSTGSGWPAALGALLDMALFCHSVIDDEALSGPAVLMRADGLRMAEDLGRMIGLTPVPSETSEAELQEAAKRLEKAGFALRRQIDFTQVAIERGRNRAWVKAMADHLGKPAALLLPGDATTD